MLSYHTAIITGASRGLGRAIARSFVMRGLNVVMVARSEPDLKAAVRELSEEFIGSHVGYYVADIRQPEDIKRLFHATAEAFGWADVLVNNAGVGTYKPLLDWTDEEIHDTLTVNLTSLIACCRAALPEMIAHKHGYIINIASDLSRRYLPNMAPYVAAKFGALGFAGSLLREVKQHGVKVTTVMPGIIDTNFNNSQEGSREETWALRPEVLAERVVELLSLPKHVVVDELAIHPMQQDF